jgi:hypothetical protein
VDGCALATCRSDLCQGTPGYKSRNMYRDMCPSGDGPLHSDACKLGHQPQLAAALWIQRSRTFYFTTLQRLFKSRDSPVGTATGYGLYGRGSFPEGATDCSLLHRPVPGPTQPPIQWVPGALSRRQIGRGVKLTTLLHQVPRSRKVELYLHSP